MDSNLEFQIISWHSEDKLPYTNKEEESDDSESDSDSDENQYKKKKKKYTGDQSKFEIFLFGRDYNDKTYCVNVKEFTPYFYVKLPDNCNKSHKRSLEYYVRSNMNWNYKKCLIRTTFHNKCSFRNFDGGKKYNFVRFVFSNKKSMRHAVGIFQERIKSATNSTRVVPKKIKIDLISDNKIEFPLYENMIDPLLKFIHHKNIDTVGWVSIKEGDYDLMRNDTTCDYNISCRWNKINKLDESRENTKIKIMAFDIECDSSHGDFPLPIKDYTKLSREIYNSFIIRYKKNTSLDKLEFAKKCMKYAFDKGNDKYDISKIFTKTKNKPDDKIISKLAIQVAEYLFLPRNLNSLELKTHNTKCINNINTVLNNSKTMHEVKKIINNVMGSNFLTNWKYKTITGSFPPDTGFVSYDDIKKLVYEIDDYEIEQELLNELPEIKGDKTIQIGISCINYGSRIPYKNYMITLNTCDTLDNADTIVCMNESEVLMNFNKIIRKENIDIITGWNTDGFDMPWLYKRASELDILEEFSKLSKFKNTTSKLLKKSKKSYIGQLITVEYVDLPGRIQMDLLPLVRKGYNLNSYKLDNVSANFITGPVIKIDYNENDNTSIIYTKSTMGLNNKNFVVFKIQDGYLENKYMDGAKFVINNLNKDLNCFTVNKKINLDVIQDCSWCLGKDDVTPKDIFRLQTGDSHDRYIIAQYCMMDVILCIELLNKLEILTNNIGMANVCKNPLSWIIHRGQGVKILSLVAYFLKSKNYLLPYLYKNSFDKEGYEGAVVLDPNPGIYIDKPVAVLDYSSLYPSSMIEVNLSHETLVTNEDFLGKEGGERLNELGYDYEDIDYDRYKTIYTPSGLVKSKVKVGVKTVRYVQYRDGSKGLIPQILEYLLNARKSTRKKIKFKTVATNSKEYSGIFNKSTGEIITENNETIMINEKDILTITDTYSEFEKKILDGLQQAFKVTANSLYGQLGAKTSDIYYKEIAASTTAVGRERLIMAQKFCEDTSNYPQIMNNGETIYLKNKIVYGDTDSVFVNFQCLDKDGNTLAGRAARKKSIDLAIYTEKKIQSEILRAPQNLEYEKTFDPFILISKKRYVGNLYEHDPDKFKRKSMGIVLKRRDNAPIVKVIYGGIIDIIMKEKDIKPATVFLRKSLRKLIKGFYPQESLIITKTLSSYYKDPQRIAHRVLADRIGDRDPGNKPNVNDRIPYIYIQTGKKVKLQGDRIETPDYINEHDLSPDYEFYITNQIMKPVTQIFALCLDELPGFTGNIEEYNSIYKSQLKKGKTINDSLKYMIERKRRKAASILFRDILRILENKRCNNIEITQFFGKGSK